MKVKWELEDWVLKTLHKKSHIEIDSKLKSTNRQRKKYINQLKNREKADSLIEQMKKELTGQIDELENDEELIPPSADPYK